MNKHFLVNQLKHETYAPASFVKKLYDLISKQELTDDEYDNTTNFDGEITLATPTYRQWVDKIHEYFPDLIINGEFYILFQDHTVEEIMAAYLLTKSVGDGIGITEENAKDKKITSIPSFRNNTDIQYFNELPYFERVTSLQGRCFQSCTNLKEIDLSNITTLNNAGHLRECTNLTKVTLGNITNIPGECFYGCTNLETIINSENIITVSNLAFRNCISLESIDLSNVIKVEYDAFWGCTLLSDIGSLSNVVSFGNNSFNGCSKLGTVNIENVETIGDNVFSQCTLLKLENSTLSKCRTIGKTPFYNTAIEEINLPICTELKYGALQQCKSLRSVSIPSIQILEDGVFYGDTLLAMDVNLPTLTTIGKEVFKFSGITKVSNLGNTITTIPNGCFDSCHSLTTIENTNENNILSNITKLDNLSFNQCDSLTTVGPLPNLSIIGNNVFDNCKVLSNISFDMSKIINIGNYAFRGCMALVIDDLNLPNLTTLGSEAFKNVKLKKISNLGNITKISGCFWGCNQLTTIDNNALFNVTELGNNTFCDCTSLTDIGEIQNLEYIGKTCFYNCSSLTTTIDFSHVKYIGTDAFKNCNNIKAKRNSKGCIDMTSIEEIASWVFNTATDFTGYIDLGVNLRKIGNQNWTPLNVNFICRCTQLPEKNGYTCFNTKEGYYVYVLDELLEDYKSTFDLNASKFKPISELPVELQ